MNELLKEAKKLENFVQVNRVDYTEFLLIKKEKDKFLDLCKKYDFREFYIKRIDLGGYIVGIKVDQAYDKERIE